MAIDLLKQEEHKRKKAAAPSVQPNPEMEKPMFDNRPLDTSVTQPFKDMKPMVEKPTLEHFDMDEVQKNARSQYIQSFDNWADASKDGTFSQQEWAGKQIEKAVAEGKNPGDYLYLTQLLGSAETPDEIKKREKREALGETFRNLGNLIGNAANLYYTNKGGQYIDLNGINEKHRERMQRIKDKQDALTEKKNNILINAKLGDLKTARAEKMAKDKANQDAAEKKAEREWKVKYNEYMKELDNAYKLGEIDAQTKAFLTKEAAKLDNSKALESFKQTNRIALKTTPSYGDDKVVDSLQIGEDIYTRNTKLTDNELAIPAKYNPEIEKFESVDEDGKVKSDVKGAAINAVNGGHGPASVLEDMGFKPSNRKSTAKKEEKKNKNTSAGLGWGSKNNSNNKTDW